MVAASVDGDRYNTVLAVLVIPYDGDRYDTVVVGRSCNIVHDRDHSRYLRMLAILYDGDRCNTVLAVSIVHDGNRYDACTCSACNTV